MHNSSRGHKKRYEHPIYKKPILSVFYGFDGFKNVASYYYNHKLCQILSKYYKDSFSVCQYVILNAL